MDSISKISDLQQAISIDDIVGRQQKSPDSDTSLLLPPKGLNEVCIKTEKQESIRTPDSEMLKVNLLQKANTYRDHYTPRTEDETFTDGATSRIPSAFNSPAQGSVKSNESLLMDMLSDVNTGIDGIDKVVNDEKMSVLRQESALGLVQATVNERTQDLKTRLQQTATKLDEAVAERDEINMKLDRVLESNKSIEKAVVTKEMQKLQRELKQYKQKTKSLANDKHRLNKTINDLRMELKDKASMKRGLQKKTRPFKT